MHASDDKPAKAVRRLEARLRGVRARARLVLLVRGAAPILIGLIGAVAVIAIADYFLRPPAFVRIAQLLIGAAIVAALLVRRVAPAWGFRPSIEDVAIRIEKASPSEAGLRDTLVSGLELSRKGGGEGEVGRRLAERASKAVKAVRLERLVRTRPAVRLGLGAGVATLALAAAVVAAPAFASIAAQRMFAPWSGAAWPKRTLIADATPQRVLAMGSEAELIAELERSPRSRGGARVEARHRLIVDGRPGEERRGLLAFVQSDNAERYVLPVTLPAPDSPLVQHAERVEIEYRLASGDDETRPVRLSVSPRPEVTAIRISVDPPAYAAGAIANSGAFFAGERSSGARPDRLTVSPVLAGSRVRFELSFNKPAEAMGEGGEAWDLPIREAATDLVLEETGAGVIVTGVLERSVRTGLVLADADGLKSTGEVVLGVDVLPDMPPAVTVTRPSRDEAVLPGAIVRLGAEARDDVGMERLQLDAQRARPPGGSAGAPPEAIGETQTLEERRAADGPATLAVEHRLDLSTLDLRPGDELWINALGVDLAPGEREPVVSARRVLRIIDEETLSAQIRRELESLRRAAMRLDETQASVMERTRRAERTGAEQSAISQRLRAQENLVSELRDRAAQNRLEDESLRGLLESAGRSLAGASSASDRAAASIEESPGDAEAMREAGEAQEEVRNRLGDLIRRLDQQQDDWLMRRDLERLIAQQEEIRARTGEIGEETVGRRPDELTDQQRRTLDELAQRQQEQASRLAELVDELMNRAAEAQESDPGRAMSLERAADAARASRAEAMMEEAAEQLSQNQTSSADQNQQRAEEAMRDMLDELDGAEDRRRDVLRRVLASVIESLDALIRAQEGEIAHLEQARPDGPFAQLAQPLFRLQGNTFGVLEQIEAGGSDLDSVARLVDQAAGAQGRAIGALRADPADDAESLRQQRISLRRLTEARDEAERLQRQAEMEEARRERQQLRRAYAEALERQIAIRDEFGEFAGRPLDRRERRELLNLAQRQETQREELEGLRTRVMQQGEPPAFDLAHDRLDRDASSSIDLMRRPPTGPELARRQNAMVRVLRSIVEALADDQEQPEFGDEAGGEGGGQGDGEAQALPPVAQLRLLRSMQIEAMERTEIADEQGADASEVDEIIELQTDLSSIANRLLEELRRQQGGGG